jgi:phage shock protein C
MHDAQHNLLTRPDTFFGVCEGLGEDFHIHPNILRVTLAGMLFWNPPAAIGAYAAAGALVALSRWLVPNPAPLAVADAADAGPADQGRAPASHELVEPDNEASPVPLAA